MVSRFEGKAGDVQACFFPNLAAYRGLRSLAPARDPARQRYTAAIVALNDEKLLIAADDSNRRAQRSEERERAIKGEAGTSDNPKQPGLQVLQKGRQTPSLACE